MKTIFAKYNSERLPKYQIVTKIVEDENNNRFALKQAMSQESHEHLDKIFSNYELLTTRYSINLVKPHETDDGVLFEMAKGRSLESVLLESLENNDKESFTKYINKFLDFVDGMVSKRDVVFEPCEEFTVIFGEWENSEPQDIIGLANIDLIFGNIFVEDDKFTLIDYEWVFDFDIPKSYVIWRSLAIFSAYHSVNLDHFTDINNKAFLRLDDSFSNFVHGKDRKHFLSSKVGNKAISIHLNYFLQLFLDHGNGFLEENSIKLPVAQSNEIQEFTFDLTDKQNIKTLRLDPLNDSCVIELESLHVKKENELIDLVPYLQTNAEINHAKVYFFITDDSQMYVSDCDETTFKNALSLVVVLRYANIAKDALQVSVKQTKGELEQTKGELEQTKNELVSLYTSRSYRMTRPLRGLARSLRKIFR